MLKDKILIIGSFRHPKNNAHVTTAAEQLAELLQKNGIAVITTTPQYKRGLKIFDTIKTILAQRNKFTIAVLPLYGTPLSFIWQNISSRLLRALRKKIILVVHGGSIPAQLEQDKTKFLKSLQRADLIVAPSCYMKKILSLYNVNALVIENVLDLSAYGYHEKKTINPYIIWMRSFGEVYNPAMAVRVAIALSKKYPDFKMVMAGSDQGLLPEIKEMIRSNNLQQKILLPGYITLHEKNKIAASYDIYISTNKIDNAPVSLIEFMAMGIPVVSVNCGGVPYLISDGENGLLVNTDDDTAMVNKIEILINDAATGKRISSNAFKYTRHYDEPYVLQKWLHAFDDILK